MLKASQARIAELEATLAAIAKEKPLDEVTVEEFLQDKPEWKKEFSSGAIHKHEYM